MPDTAPCADTGSVPDTRHAFTFREFRFFWIARLCSVIAMNAMVLSIGWQVYDIARQTMGIKQASLQLGLIGMAQFAPLFFLTLITGWTADRVDRRIIARLAVGLHMVCASGLAWLAWHSLNGNSKLAPIFLIASLLGVARAFYMPAMNALAPNLVPRAVLPRAIATNALAARIGGVAGPALGGYAYAVAPHMAYLFSATLCGISLLCLLMLRPVAKVEIDRSRNPWQQMIQGFHYVTANRLLLGAISLDLFAVLLGGATALLPVYARDILHVGPSGLGHLRTATAIGATAMAFWLAWKPLRQHIGFIMLASVGLFGAATLVFGLSRSFPLSLIGLTVLGAADMISVYVRQSIIQISTPDDMRGRVGAISALFISASNELGEAESGFLAALIGPVATVVAGGIGSICIALIWAKWFPELRAAKRFD
jgi:MFS family permease